MSHNVWLGGAKKINQVSTYLVGSSTNGHVFTILLRNPLGGAGDITIVSYTAGGSETATTIATELLSLLNTGAVAGAGGGGTGSATNWKHDLNQALTWTRDTATLTATANVAGVPFRMSDTGSGTATVTTTTANAGPNDWDCGSNWSLATVPVNSDTVEIQGTYPILYPTRGTVPALAELIIKGNAAMGHPGIPMELDIVLVTVDNGVHLHLELQTTTTTRFRVVNCPALHVYGDNSAVTDFICEGGNTYFVGVTGLVITDLNIEDGAYVESYIANPTNAVVAAGGRFISRAVGNTFTTLVNNGGVIETQGTCIVTTLTNNSGITTSNSTGTITTVNANGGVVDFTQSKEARTVTTLTLAGGTVLASTSIITFTNAPAATRPYRWSEVAA